MTSGPSISERRAAARARTRQRRRRRIAGLVLIVVVLAVVGLMTISGGGSPATSHTQTATQPTGQARQRRPRTVAAALPLTGIPVGRWTSLPDSPASRGEVSAARIGDVVYIVGGFDSSGQTTAEVQRLNLRTGAWSPSPPMPEALNHMSAVSYGGSLYVVGGYSQPSDTSAGSVRGFWRFDPASGRWSTMPPAPVARAAAGAAVLNGRLYVAGGRSDTIPALSTLAIFDFATQKWSLGPPLVHAREHVAAVAAGGAVWVLGGRVLGLGSFTDVQRYRPGAPSWETMSPMPVARSGFQAVAVPGEIVTVGGENGTQMVDEVDRLDLRTGHWSSLPGLPTARHGLGLVADGPLVFSIDGGPAPGLTTSHVVQRLRVG